MLFAKKISLKKYPLLGTYIPNPIDLTKLPRGKTYQIAAPHFILQFFFDGKNLSGVIAKRDQRQIIRVRWCLFRNCEHSPYDYSVTIAESFSPPFEDGFFTVKFPPGLQYEFQGLEFFTP
ncbi:MAG: hypothetical protein A3K09_05545 [Nitrospinae bacterium RIFCSPLOWO2_12_FULL_47_7]|nr:MAG: hypothetical protein A3K09_05545 [Nitrospinae bacterium RIFCSPLOWO2_12_FULL_47_7]